MGLLITFKSTEPPRCEGGPTELMVGSIPTCLLLVTSKLCSWRKNKPSLKYLPRLNQRRKRFLKRNSRGKSSKWIEVKVRCNCDQRPRNKRFPVFGYIPTFLLTFLNFFFFCDRYSISLVF